MNFSQINNPNDGSSYYIGTYEDFECATPIEKYRELFLGHTFFSYKILFAMQRLQLPIQFIEKLFGAKAEIAWQEEYKRIKSIKIPSPLEGLLSSTSKKEQEKLLRGLSLNIDELMAFILKAGENQFTWSQYKASHNHKGFDETQLPQVIEVDGGTVRTVGTTTLSEAQLTQVVEHRKVKISKFLDKGNTWHCFFLTYKSLGGKERHNNGQPHIHYISNFWEITRDNVVAQLTNRDYSLPSTPHIDYRR